MEMTLGQIADAIGGKVRGNDLKPITDAAPLNEAGPDQIAFAGSQQYLKRLDETNAGAVIVPNGFEAPSKNLIWSDNPQVAFAKILSIFHPTAFPRTGISPDASIGEHVRYGEDVSIGSHVAIADHVTFGNRVTIYPGVVIGHHVTLGDDVTIYPNVTIREGCRIGSRVIIHAGTVIGSDGFGLAPDGERYVKIPQIGIVQIDDDVEIGAVNTIDRSAFGRTWIQSGVKTDNLIHIGHNVTIGENTVIASQCGLSGSVTVGRHVVMAGQVGVADHLSIGDQVTIGPRGKIYHSVAPGQTISGEQMPHKLWLRFQATLPRLPELKKKVTELERKINQILEKMNRS